MVGGIVLVSLSAIPMTVGLLAATCGDSGSQNCDASSYFLGGMAITGVLVGVGIPLILIGAKREGAPTASVAPWATPHSAGLALHLQL